ncbi:MAG: signal peptidase II [Dehalococcoidia bacterium]|nr:signal peptidase II [Dehalococcoidia bacterium]
MTNTLKIKLSKHLLFLSTAAAVLISDQITKSLIRAHMTLGQSIPADGKFRLTFSTNEGAVFGLGLDTTFLTIVACVVAVMMVWLYFHHLSRRGWPFRLGMGLVLGGAIGNLVDRFRFGAVTDFLDVRLWGGYHWPSFNIADASLSTGVVILAFALLTLFESESPQL